MPSISAAPLDCQTCGACCAYSADWPRFTLEEDAQLDAIPAALVAADGSGMRCTGTRCDALVGSIGVAASCSIYPLRPDVCRVCEPGGDECGQARWAYGLAPPPSTPAATSLTMTDAYVPEAGPGWERIAPADAGFDAPRLDDAVAYAIANESPWPRSLHYPDGRYVGIVEWNETGPWSDVVGPVRERGGPAGLVLKGGRVVAEWGDTSRPDMTFSVAKSYLAILAGLAHDDGLIADVDEPVCATVDEPGLADGHNRRITWRHLLQQSSEWDGELFGKSDQVDHHRQIGPGADNSRKGELRLRQPPGSHYEYNDVRVNLLALCLLKRFGRALPDILRERVMGPIGASPDWEWHGYSSSFVEIDGRPVQSVPGGSHWGGGLFMGTQDHARVGLLVARRGEWGGRRILSEAWIDAMLTPSPTLPNYGYLWWLNRGPAARPELPASAFSAMGAGSNAIWVDPEHDLVAVVRWIDKAALEPFFVHLVAAALG